MTASLSNACRLAALLVLLAAYSLATGVGSWHESRTAGRVIGAAAER